MTMPSIPLAEIPYLNLSCLGSRMLPPLCFYHQASRWEVWIPDSRIGSAKNSFVKLTPGDCDDAPYFAPLGEYAHEDDLFRLF